MNSYWRLSLFSALVMSASLSFADTQVAPAKWLEQYNTEDETQFRKAMDAPLVKRSAVDLKPGQKPPAEHEVVLKLRKAQEQLKRDLEMADRMKDPIQASKAREKALAALVKAKENVRGRLLVEVEVRKRKQKVKVSEIKSGRADIHLGDEAERLMTDTKDFINNVTKMEAYKTGEVKTQPWSDDYWGIYRGQMGARYGDAQNFGRVQGDIYSNYEAVIRQYPAHSVLASRTDADPSLLLSPSEKYDLLFHAGSGPAPMTLTKAQWAKARSMARPDGKVETWMGICHGWAPAAYMFDRPIKPVTLTSLSGQRITFLPADIKALASYLWAQVAPNARFVGGRCNDKDVRKSLAGRILDQQCFDTNPGSWHQAIVNKVGRLKESFVMDATFDYEVWNHPIKSYSITYFNPVTNRPVNSAKEGLVPLTDFKRFFNFFNRDKFKDYRGKGTHVVGVIMDVVYVVETRPTLATSDDPSRDGLKSVRYTYDLETTSDGTIKGGEWYTNAHPDFLWTYDADQRALTGAEHLASVKWDPTSDTPPAQWASAAEIASARAESPLAAFVEELVRRGSK